MLMEKPQAKAIVINGPTHVTVNEPFKKSHRHPAPPFDPTGMSGISSTGIRGYPDLKETRQSISQTGMWLWWELIEVKDKFTNIAVFKLKNPKQNARKLFRAYQELAAVKFVFRIKKQTYMLNPKVAVPIPKNYIQVAERWKMLQLSNQARQTIREL